MPRDEGKGRVGALDEEAIFRGVVEQSPTGVYVLRQGRIIYANPRFVEMFGRSYEDLLDLPSIAALAVPSERARVVSQVAQREARDVFIHYTTTALRKDGSTFEADIFGGSIVVGGERLAVGTVVDVTDRVEAEAKLRDERRWLDSVLEALPVGVWMTNADAVVMRRNAAAVDIEARGLDLRIPSEERPIRRTLRTGIPIIKEAVELSDDTGKSVDALAWTAPIRESDGTLMGGVAVLLDVTEKRRAERALEFERARLATVFEQAPAFLCVLRGPQHVYELANEAYYALVGRRELIGRRVADALPEIVDQGFIALLDRVFETGEIFVGREIRVLIARSLGGAKEERFVDFIYRALVEQDGSRSGILVHGVDVTDRVRANAALQASERRVRAQFKGVPVPAYVWQLADVGDGEKDLVLVDYNDSALELSDGKVSSIHGGRASKIHADRPDIVRDLHDALGGAKIRREMDYRYISGAVRRLVVTYAPAPPDIVLVHTEDITDRTRLAEQLNQAQKMEAIGRLAGGVAHDFNNLLTVITTCATFLSESLADRGEREQVQDVESIREAANQAAMLTKQLLAFSRRQLLVPTTLDLNDVTRSLEPMIRRLIGEDIRVVVETASDLATVKADRSQIEQVLMNLLVNARDAMPTGGTITISTRNVVLDGRDAARLGVDPGSYAVVAVRDTGSGMHETIAARVFEPFFTTKETGRGTGLGLSTAYGIARQSGGFVTVETAVGEGSTFELGLPCSGGTASARSSDAGRDVVPRGSGTVLLVEDEPAVRTVTKRLLERMGYVVVDAGNGRAALEILQRAEHRFDLLVTDVVMPELGGRELHAKAKAIHPALPVLFMTGYTDDEILRRSTGDQHPSASALILPKPFTADELTTAVRRALGRER